ncbi:hypothetical protein PSTG_00682 [Puccinia striiformis f. sp. tritici PST-78]|uniref:Ubiquitin-like domain-containing protein n=1 Tax=Puccinia striiformis f. sp. tritici PST-78 TaxID=1165861 RepID=A0A0L0W3P9_9BASI|nr:hypothetical protein PSTG_00682 [Puccinia striiformis f. sp. tritici PST-78]
MQPYNREMNEENKKNKQEEPPPALEQDSNHLPLTFNIRFASDGHVPDLLNVWVGDRESVRDFKRRIQLLRPALDCRRLRLIYLGRVLTDGTLLVPWTEQLIRRQNNQIRSSESVTRVIGTAMSGALGAVKGGYDAAIGAHNRKGKGKEIEPILPGSTAGTHQRFETIVWLQCAVGEIISPSVNVSSIPGIDGTITSTTIREQSEDEGDTVVNQEEHQDQEEEEDQDQDQEGRPLSGFDRLAEAGFSEEDIEQVRRQFHSEHQFISSPTGFVDTDEEEHARAMEDQWLEGLNSTQDGVDNGMGTHIYSTLFKGLCIGFFFPIIPIFFFRTELLDRRTQLAILSGSAINFLFGVLQYTNS